MKTHCAIFLAASLDGFIARKDGQIDWLNQINLTVPPGEDCGFAKFMSTIDVLVMGARLFIPFIFNNVLIKYPSSKFNTTTY